MSSPTICVIGMGYIGLPTSIVFANNGLKVSGYDINPDIVSCVNNKTPRIVEPELEERLCQAVDSGNLRAYTNTVSSDIFIISVPTPIHHDSKAPDLRYVESAVHSIIPVLKKGDMVVLESTVPPGTTRNIIAPVIKEAGFVVGEDIDVAHAPEKAIPGRLFYELEHNDRIVGGINDRSTSRVAELYRKLTSGKIMTTDATSAEMVKLVENTYRDVNIALANEFALFAEKLGLDIWDIIEFANHHPRVHVHQPGPGVGGHCIAVDPWFLVHAAPETMKLVNMARDINDSMPSYVVDKIARLVSKHKDLKPKVTILGLTFKANIDDVRESPSITICDLLRKKGIEYAAYDPWVKSNVVEGQTQDIKKALLDSDLAVVLVAHDQFKTLNPKQMAFLMRHKAVLDTKQCLVKGNFVQSGYQFLRLGEGACPVDQEVIPDPTSLMSISAHAFESS